MPEIVSCPHCRRRSRLPDSLMGKKVRCPECKEVFTATVAAPAPPPPVKKEGVKPKRDDAEDPGYEVVDEDEDEGKPKKKRRTDDDDERVSDRPRSRRHDDGDDDDDERVTSRRRRFNRDEEDDDDDDDDDDEDDAYRRPRKRPKVRANWPRVLSGLTLIMWSTILTVCLAIALFVGMLVCGGMGAAAARGGGAAGAGAGVAGLVILGLLAVVGFLACYVMKIVGHVLCLPSPPARGAKILALVTVILVFTDLGCMVLEWVIGFAQSGMAGLAGAANPMPALGGMGGMAAVGAALVLTVIRLLATVATFFVFLFYLRAIALITGNDWLASNIVKFMIASIAVVVGGFFLTIVMVAVIGGAAGRAAANQGEPGVGVGVCGCVSCITELVVGVGMLVWYIQILVNTRNALAGRMGRA
jgi:hypothetical protein